MKRSYLLMMALSLGALTLQAQIDDVYYVPTAEQRAAEKAQQALESSYSNLEGSHAISSNENWAKGRRGNFDTDAYNRRSRSQITDTINASDFNNAADDWNCTTRLVRFHAPTVGIIVSSPYYMDYYDYWYSPLSYRYYDPFWSDWSWYGWGRPWYYSCWGWSSWAWHSPWYSGWYGGYSPWYGGWGWSSYPRYWGYTPRYDYGWHDRNYQRGPVGGGRSFGNGSRSYSNNGYNSRPYTNRQNSSRSYDNSNSSRTSGRYYNTQTPSAPSRNYEAPVQPRTYSSPAPSSAPRTYSGGGGMSGGGRSTSGGGGGRTFGR